MFVCMHACLIDCFVAACALREYVRALVGACVYEYNNVPSMRGFVCACLRAYNFGRSIIPPSFKNTAIAMLH